VKKLREKMSATGNRNVNAEAEVGRRRILIYFLFVLFSQFRD
jgi:hypothetical protein